MILLTVQSARQAAVPKNVMNPQTINALMLGKFKLSLGFSFLGLELIQRIIICSLIQKDFRDLVSTQ